MFVRRTFAALAIGAVLAGGAATAASADAPEGMTETAYRALQLRSEGMNSYAKTLQAPAPAAPASASTSFAWDDFGIGMASAFGLVVLMGGLVVAVRAGTRKRVSVPS